MIFLTSLVLQAFVLSAPTVEEITKLLEYQYAQKLLPLQQENAELREQIRLLKKKEESCVPASKASLDGVEVEKLKQKDEEEKIYREALKAVQNETWDEALLRMEHFVKYFSSSDLADNAVLWMAHIYLQKHEKELAREELERLLRDFPQGDRALEARAMLEKISSKKLDSITGGEQ